MDDYAKLSNFYSRIMLKDERLKFDLEIIEQLLKNKKFDHLHHYIMKRLDNFEKKRIE